MPFPERIGPTALSDSNATLLTANRPLMLVSIMVTNTDSTARTVRVNLVPAGSSPTQSNRIVADLSTLANDVRRIPILVPLAAGDTLQGFASVANVVNLTIVTSDDSRVLHAD